MNAKWETPKLLIAWAPMKKGQNFEPNPGNGTKGTAIGFRLFPDLPVPPNQLPPTDNRDDYRKAKVIAQVYDEPRGNKTVYLRLFDLDDPSADGFPIDSNDTKDQTGNIIYKGGDNRPDGTGVPPSGVFEANGTVDYQVVTDVNGRAEAIVILSRQPGNNFKVAGAFDEGVRNGLHIKEGTQEQALRVWTADNKRVPEGNEPDIIPVARATELLTVWRRLHVEVDSMGVVVNNTVTGNILSVKDNGDGTSVLTIDIIPWTIVVPGYKKIGDSPNRFVPGTLKNGGNNFPVVGNTGREVKVKNLSLPDGTVITPSPGVFELVDDDKLLEGVLKVVKL